jgi:hypothetical protein
MRDDDSRRQREAREAMTAMLSADVATAAMISSALPRPTGDETGGQRR